MKSNIRPARHVRAANALANKLHDIKSIEIMADLKSTIRQLNSAGQQHILDFILLLRQEQTNKTTPDQDRKLAMWCDSLNLALSNILGQTHNAFSPVLLPQAKKILKDVTEFLSVNDLGDMKTTEVKVMYNLLAKILVNHASGVSANIKIPLSMKLVLQTQTPILSLFDNFFPGYVKAKLVRQILMAGKNPQIVDRDDD